MVHKTVSNRFSAASVGSASHVIGHRGAAGHAPENTLPSLIKAHELGVSWVEFDVKLSGDDVPVLFHDNTLDRNTNGRGPIADQNLRELKMHDAGAWFSEAFAGTPVPTLDEAMVVLAKCSMGANVEIKPSKGRETETGIIVGEALAKTWPTDLPLPLVSSFSATTLQACAIAAPHLAQALLVSAVPKNWRAQLNAVQTDTLHCMSRRLRERRAKEILKAGYTLRCFTVNQPKRARQLLDWGVHGIISDYPDRILKVA